MKCIECNNLGYFTGVVSLGLPEGHPYLQPHIERCDICQVFASDEQAASSKLQAASHKLQAASDKHLTKLNKGLYRRYERYKYE